MNRIQLFAPLLAPLFVAVVLIVLSMPDFRLGNRSDDGVLNEGTLIEYRYNVVKRNHTAVAMIDGKMQAVSTWWISYIDKNGKIGNCNYYVPLYNAPKINEPIECSKQKLIFN